MAVVKSLITIYVCALALFCILFSVQPQLTQSPVFLPHPVLRL